VRNVRVHYCEHKFHILCATRLNNILYKSEGTIKCTTVSYFVWDVTVQYSAQQSRSAQEVKPLCRILHCHDSSTMWNRCTHYCTVMTSALCETAVHSIVLLRLIHYVKLLCWILHCHISHKIWNCRAFYCTFTFVQNVIQSRRTQDVKRRKLWAVMKGGGLAL
jgi:hypothetical protein